MIKRRIGGLILIFTLGLFAAGCATGQDEPAEGKVKDKVVPVEVVTAARGDLVISRQKGARLTAGREAMVVPAMPGEVVEVLVSVGEHVEKDQVLIRLDDTAVRQQIDQARAAYNTAKANVALSRQSRADLEAQKADAQQDLDDFYEDVDIDDVEDDLEDVYDAIADLNDAMKNGLLPSRDYYDVAYSELAAARDQLTGVLSQEAMLKQAMDAVDNAIKSLPFNEDTLNAQLNQARLGVTMAEDALDALELKAPAAGTVASVLVSEGDIASQTMPPVTIIDTETLILQVPLTEYEVTCVSAGASMTFSVDALDDIYDGVVEWVSPAIDARTQSFYARVRAENGDGELKPGMYARADVTVDEAANAVLLPKEALVREDSATYAYLIKDGTARRVEVRLGLDDGYTVQVLSGVEAGDTVVVKGQAYLNDGIAIEITEGAAS
jgi:RND family efflux transporter MFP subunit